MSFTASEVKAMVAGYFRYKKQCPVVAFEASNILMFATSEPADVLVVTESRMLYEIEVKISISDLKNDIKKKKHWSFINRPNYLPVHKFYFAVPQDITDIALDICNDLYPYAGLLSVTKFPFHSAAASFGVIPEKPPKHLNPKPLSLRQIVYMVKEQSGTLCRLARAAAVADKKHKDALSENCKLIEALKEE